MAGKPHEKEHNHLPLGERISLVIHWITTLSSTEEGAPTFDVTRPTYSRTIQFAGVRVKHTNRRTEYGELLYNQLLANETDAVRKALATKIAHNFKELNRWLREQEKTRTSAKCDVPPPRKRLEAVPSLPEPWAGLQATKPEEPAKPLVVNKAETPKITRQAVVTYLADLSRAQLGAVVFEATMKSLTDSQLGELL